MSSYAADLGGEVGQTEPIEVFEINGKKYVINGHHRPAAAKAAGTNVDYRVISLQELQAYGYQTPEDVIAAASEAGPNRLR